MTNLTMTQQQSADMQYTFVRKISSSLCGKVMLAKDSQNELVVCKVSQRVLMDKAANEDPEAELMIMEMLSRMHAEDPEQGSEFILKLSKYLQTPTESWGILEYCDGGDLFEHVKSNASNPAALRSEMPSYFVQITQGLSFLHTTHVVHRDLSLENVLLHKSDQSIRIADFGMSDKIEACEDGSQKILYNSNPNEPKSRPGKLGYLSPELLSMKAYDGKAADVFALGVCLFQLLSGVPPFRSATAADPCWRFIRSGNLKKLVKGWRLEQLISPLAMDLLNSMFSPEDKRPTCAQVMEHPFFLECAKKATESQERTAV